MNHIFWVAKVSHDGKESGMINGAKSIFKVNIKEVYILVSEFSIFESINDNLELSSSAAFSTESFLAVM
jgi:hypothetical protein